MKFQKGRSGNPAGRKPGTKTTSARLREMIAGDVPAVLAVVRDAALSGDIQAASLLISRVLPPVRAEAVCHEVPAGNTIGERAEAVVCAVLDGDIPPDVGQQLVSVLGGQAKIWEVTELLERIERLENALVAIKENQSC